MNTQDIRKEANALLGQAEASLTDGNVEQFEGMIADAQTKMAEADKIDLIGLCHLGLGVRNHPLKLLDVAVSEGCFRLTEKGVGLLANILRVQLLLLVVDSM